MQETIVNIINEMAEYLSIAQMKKLQEVLLRQFTEKEQPSKHASNTAYLQLFLDAKRIEGCSDRTLRYYRTTNERATLQQINLSDLRVQQIMVPPMELQDAIAAFIEQTDKSKFHYHIALVTNKLCGRA